MENGIYHDLSTINDLFPTSSQDSQVYPPMIWNIVEYGGIWEMEK